MWWLRLFAHRTEAERELGIDLPRRLEQSSQSPVEQSDESVQYLFGRTTAAEETTRDRRACVRLLNTWRGVSLLVRSFTRAKGFAMAAVLIVALGIGANTLVFSMFDRVLFRPLPYDEPHRMVQLHSQPGMGDPALPLAVTLELARQPSLFAGIGWADGGEPVPLITVAGENPVLWLTSVTTNSLEVLGIRPVIGPGFSAMRATSFERPVLLTYETWQRQYGGSDDVLALSWMTRDAQQRDIYWRVVGVLPQGFLLPSPRPVTAPYDAIYGVDPGFERQLLSTETITVAPFARLAPGISFRAAQARVDAYVAARFPRPTNMFFQRAKMISLQSGLSAPGRRHATLAVVGAWAILVATSLTLTILLLTWSQSRRQDAGVRLALGASPRRLVISALAESVILCAAGAVIGWLVYAWTRSLFMSLMPPGLRSFAVETADVRVIAVTGGVALMSALAAGTLPALRAAQTSPLHVLRSQQDSMRFDRLFGGSFLLSVQAAFGVMLLVSALAILPGVLRSLLASPGFDAHDLFMVNIPTSNDKTASDAREQTRRGLAALEVVHQISGVLGAALSRSDPFWPPSWERPGSSNRSGFAGRVLPVDADFFRTLAVPLKAGRAFSDADIEQQSLVAMVNEAGARALWPDQPVQSAINRTVPTHDGPRLVVGVAADFHIGIDTPVAPTLFLPLSATEAYSSPDNAFPYNSYRVMIRMVSGRIPDRALLSDKLREQPWMISNWTGPQSQSVVAELDAALETPRLLALIFGALAAIALLLTGVAMYGLSNFEIWRRREEMTVRLALGATPRALRRRLAVAVVKPVLVGILVGLPMGWVIARVLSASVAVGSASDLWIYAAAAATILVAALIAAWLPGRRFFSMRTAELLRSS